VRVAITKVDETSVAPTKWVHLSQSPIASTYTFSHALSLHNYGSSSVKKLLLVALPGPKDSRPLAKALSVVVTTSADNFMTSTSMPLSTLAALEAHPLVPIPLAQRFGSSSDLQIRLTYSVADLANSLQGSSVAPMFTFYVGG
jgi:hypothetical protein